MTKEKWFKVFLAWLAVDVACLVTGSGRVGSSVSASEDS